MRLASAMRQFGIIRVPRNDEFGVASCPTASGRPSRESGRSAGYCTSTAMRPLSGRSTAACGVPKADIAQGVAKRKPITSAYVRIPPGPPLTLAKGVSRSGYGRIFQLFSRVMRESLFTGLGARRHGSVLSEPIFSGPIACALLVNSLQAAETKASFIWCC